VIRREFDIAEGDPYNRTLIDRAERRLRNLNYFKTVKISNRPGSSRTASWSTSRRSISRPGDINVAGGYSTTDGALVELKIGERNFYGTGKNLQASFAYGQYSRGVDLLASEPYFLGTRISAGVELFGRQSDVTSYQSYGSNTYGANCFRDAAHRRTRRAVAIRHLQPGYHTCADDGRPPAVVAGGSSRPRPPDRPGSPPPAAPQPTARWTIQKVQPVASGRSSARIWLASAAM